MTKSIEELTEEYYKESGWVPTENAVMNFKAGAKARDSEWLKVVNELKMKLKTCENDYWFMTNLLEKYSTDKEQAIKDCIERMKFRKPLFNVTKAAQMLKEMGI